MTDRPDENRSEDLSAAKRWWPGIIWPSWGRSVSESRKASDAAKRSRLLIVATVEWPHDRERGTDDVALDVRNALTDYGYYVVRASA